MSDMNRALLEALGLEYQELARTAANCKARQDDIRREAIEQLPPYVPDTPSSEQSWVVGPTRFQWVKGRETTKTDVDKFRKKLLLAGVAMSVVDQAYEAATTRSVGSPSVRIMAADPNLQED